MKFVETSYFLLPHLIDNGIHLRIAIFYLFIYKRKEAGCRRTLRFALPYKLFQIIQLYERYTQTSKYANDLVVGHHRHSYTPIKFSWQEPNEKKRNESKLWRNFGTLPQSNVFVLIQINLSILPTTERHTIIIV